MKTIIYTGVVLMAAAAVYGFADLSKDQPKDLYETKIVEPVATTKEAAVLPVVNEEKKVVPVKRAAKKRESKVEEVTEKELRPINSEVALPKTEETTVEEPLILKENTSGKKIEAAKKKKRVKTKMFSRAPLSEEYIDEVRVKKAGNRQW